MKGYWIRNVVTSDRMMSVIKTLMRMIAKVPDVLAVGLSSALVKVSSGITNSSSERYKTYSCYCNIKVAVPKSQLWPLVLSIWKSGSELLISYLY